ncbi:MAG: hypothetical protein O2816_05645 [Planctomycetota bacterium]|nr:hypothetical protein [Planctomycetota bacterium]
MLPLLASALLLCPQDDPQPVPIQVVAMLAPCTDQGTFILRLECTATEALTANHPLRVALCVGTDDVASLDFVVKPALRAWVVGETVDLAFPIAMPEGLALEFGDLVSLRIGFVVDGAQRPPAVADHLIDPDGLADLVAFDWPRFAGPAGRARLDGVLARGKELRKLDPPGAWALLSQALRDAADDATKAEVRDALIEVGKFEPAQPSEVEVRVVAQRIRAEQVRVFRLEAGRMAAGGRIHGALVLLEEIGGALAMDVDDAVIGALNDAERMTARIEDLQERLLTELTKDEAAQVDADVEQYGRTEELFARAERLAGAGKRPVALALYRKLRRVDGVELYDRAQTRLEEVGALHLKDVPQDQLDQVEAIRKHPAWARTEVARSHEFLYIGPRELVHRIPDDSKLNFDLAYVFLTDLFGRKPNPKGDRVTVYFKELWDFGGGVGGGKIIDIGSAQPSPARPTQVDTGLLYHELTHCIDDTRPIFAGHREGLANLGAAYAYEALDRDGDAQHSFAGNLRQFEDFYLARDLEYWRIQNYGPSAGFFLSFLERYAKVGKSQHDWSGLRRFFREYRTARVSDGREPQIARGLAYYLGRAFGPQVFDDLVRYRFPLVEADRRQLFEESEAYDLEDLEPFRDAYADRPGSPLPRDLVARELIRQAKRDELAACEQLRADLGVVFDWKVIGPFFAASADPLAHVFPPELEVDFAKKPRTLRSSRDDVTQVVWQDPWPSWQRTATHKNVELRPSGWLRFDYQPYGDDRSAIYALSHITVDADVEAFAHVRADDDVAIFVNDVRAGSYRSRGINGSTERWRGPFVDLPDAHRLPISLKAGRNKLLVKIRNQFGDAGLILALSNTDGSPLVFEDDNGPPDPVGLRPEVLEPRYWKRLVTLDHRALRSKAEIEVGGFKARNKAFAGTETDRGVAWRQWTVRPGFPKDSPSNLLWIKDSVTKKLGDAVQVRVAFAGTDAPKVLVTVQGEGKTDGLSGWNLILVPSGGKVSARLERYDRLVYESDPIELAEVEDGRELLFTVWRGWAKASLDGVELLPRVSIDPIPGRTRVGVATWGPAPVFQEIEVLEGR